MKEKNAASSSSSSPYQDCSPAKALLKRYTAQVEQEKLDNEAKERAQEEAVLQAEAEAASHKFSIGSIPNVTYCGRQNQNEWKKDHLCLELGMPRCRKHF